MAVAADTYGPFDAGAGANVTEDTWRKMMRNVHGVGVRGSGVLRTITNTCNVFADSSGMQVKVNTGEVWIRGHWGEFTSTKTLPIATAHATLARKDRVVARADFSGNQVVVDVLTGTPAGSPTVPALTQDTGKWEISLGIVDVPATDTTIDSGQVTDARHYVDRDPVAAIATSDTTANNDTAPDIISSLSVPVSANARYALFGCIMASGSTTADVKIRFNGPAGATAQITPNAMGLGVPAAQFYDMITRNIVGLATDITFGTYNTGSGNKSVALPVGDIATVDAAGSVYITFSQNVADATNTVLYTGSWFTLVRMD